MAKIKLKPMLSTQERELCDTLCAVLQDCIKYEEKDLVRAVTTIVRSLEWTEPQADKVVHMVEMLTFLQSNGKCLYMDRHPQDHIDVHLGPSNATRLQRALVPLYETLCKRTSNGFASGRFRCDGQDNNECTNVYWAKAEMEEIGNLLNTTESLRIAYHPLLYDGPFEEHLCEEMRFFRKFQNELKKMVQCKQDMIAHFGNLVSASQDVEHYDKYLN